MARRARYGRTRDRLFLVRLPGGRARRTSAGGNSHRGFSFAGRGSCREGRLLHQHAAAAAVAPKGRRSSRRCAERDVVHVPPGPPPEGKSEERSAAAQRRSECVDLGLFSRRETARTQGGRGPSGNQRLFGGGPKIGKRVR